MRRNQRIKEILSYIREHFTEKITLDEIAKHLHLSTNECCRFFKKNMNCTLFEYITEYRLSKSMELLEHTDLPVSQIAYESGFGSSSYFIEKFRKNVGMTPAAFRKAGRWILQKTRISSSGISAIIRRKDLVLLLECGALTYSLKRWGCSPFFHSAKLSIRLFSIKKPCVNAGPGPILFPF